MKAPWLHPSSQSSLKTALQNPAHCMIFTGKKGVGLATIAHYAASELGDTTPYVVRPEDGGSIKIESVRKLYALSNGKKASFKVYIIEEANKMSTAAQNTLLKLIEEPTKNSIFILTTHFLPELLPTVRSRAQTQTFLPLTQAQHDEFVASLGITDAAQKAQLNYIAPGLPDEIIRLHENNDYWQKRAEDIKRARIYISGKTYEKLIVGYKVSGDRATTLQLIQDAARMVEITMKQKPTFELATTLDQLTRAEDALFADGTARVQLLKLSLF